MYIYKMAAAFGDFVRCVVANALFRLPNRPWVLGASNLMWRVSIRGVISPFRLVFVALVHYREICQAMGRVFDVRLSMRSVIPRYKVD